MVYSIIILFIVVTTTTIIIIFYIIVGFSLLDAVEKDKTQDY